MKNKVMKVKGKDIKYWKQYANGVWYPKYAPRKKKRFYGNPGTAR